MDKTLLMPREKNFGSSSPTVTYNFMKKGSEWAPHWHDYFEFELIAEGFGEHTYNNTHYELKPGSAYLMSYYDFHAIKAKTDMTLVNIHFGEDFIDKEIENFISGGINKFNCEFNENEFKEILSLAEKIKNEEHNSLAFKDVIIKGYLTDIIVRTIRNSHADEDKKIPLLIQKTIAYVYKNFKNNLNLKSVAKEMYVTPNYLGVFFKKSIGISFNDYINMLRLKYACNMLTHSSMSVKEIGFASGYNSTEYFLYTFKKHLGTTPAKYRNNERKSHNK